MPEEPYQPFDWFDTRAIEREHDRIVAQNRELTDHLTVVHQSLRALHSMLRHQPYEENTRALVALRLAARVFNTAGSALKCARVGFFQPAFSMIRDVLEVEFLTDLFTRDSIYLDQWIELDPNQRAREFQQVKVRKILDDLDGLEKQKRKNAYKLLSNYATHATPEGFSVISPNNMTQIGPFPCEERLTAFFQELTKHLQMPCIHLFKLLIPLEANVENEKQSFVRATAEWRNKYMSPS